MAIAYVSSGNASSVSGSNPTFSFSVPGANHMLIIALQMSNSGTGASAVSYGGQAMTQVGSEIAPQANLRASLWYLYNPPTGSNTLAVTGTSSMNNTTIAYSLFTGMKSTGPVDSNGSNTGTGTAITASTTVVGANCWLVGGCWQGATINSMTNATNRSTSIVNCSTVFDSNGTVATGSRSVTCTYSANDSQGMILASWLPGTNTTNQSMTATIAVTGRVLKELSKTLIATSAVSASVRKGLSKTIIATTVLTASIVKQMSKTLIATTVTTVTMVATKVYLQALTATTAITASITKIPGKLLSASTAVSASIAKVSMLARTLTATTVVTGAITKGLSKTIAATTSVTASVAKTPGIVLRATTNVTASVQSGLAKILVATTNISATLTAGRAVIMVATVTTTANIGKTVGKLLSVTLAIIAKVRAPFYKLKYPSHGDGEDYEIKYPHE